jgi:hypothetical protein
MKKSKNKIKMEIKIEIFFRTLFWMTISLNLLSNKELKGVFVL